MTDLLLVNANVLTMNPARPRASAIAVTGGRITALDADGPAGQVLDLRGLTVLRCLQPLPEGLFPRRLNR
jgi:predicted amidohydrolase YtcJ